MQVTKGTWRMREQCVPGSLSSSPAQEPGNEATNTHVSTQKCSTCRAVAIKFGVVRLVVVRKHATAKGVWGHTPQKFWEFRGYEVASETISGPK